MRRAFRVVHALMVGILTFGAGVQVNDPDPWLWITVYLLGAGLTGLAAIGRAPRGLPAVAALAGLGAAAWLGATGVNWGYGLESETGREALGLAILGAWMVPVEVSAWWERRARRRARGDT